MQKEERRSLQAKISSLKEALGAVSNQLDEQRRRISLAADAATRYGGLLRGQYISTDQFQQKEADRLDQSSRLSQLLREKMSTLADLQVATSDA
jgi:membrane fusion protein